MLSKYKLQTMIKYWIWGMDMELWVYILQR